MGSGRKKIDIKKIENIKNRRVTFTKRRKGLFKKAEELSRIAGCRVSVMAFSSNSMKPYLYGDLSLLEAAAFHTSNGLVKFETFLSGAGNFEIRSCSTSYASVGDDLGKALVCVDGGDDKDLCFTGRMGSDEDLNVGVANSCNSVITSLKQNNSDYSSDLVNDLMTGDDKDMLSTDDETAKLIADLENGSLGINATMGDDFGGLGGDVKDLCFTDEEFAELMGGGWDKEPVAAGGENASCGVETNTSSDDLTMMMHQYCNSDYNEDNALKMIPSSSPVTVGFENYSYDNQPPAATGTATEQKECRDVTNECSVEEEKDLEELSLAKQRIEAFKEAMKEEYMMACEAGEMVSEDPFMPLATCVFYSNNTTLHTCPRISILK